MDDILSSPGATAAFGDASGADGGSLPNLDADFSPSLSNLMNTSSGYGGSNSSYSALTGLLPSSTNSSGIGSITSPSLSSASNYSGLFTSLGSAANSLLGAFVTNPQNAQTAEQQAATTAGLQLESSSQIFSYLLLGLGIFLIFTFLEKK